MYFIMYKNLPTDSYRPLLDNVKDKFKIRVFDTIAEAERFASETFKDKGTWFIAEPVIHATTL